MKPKKIIYISLIVLLLGVFCVSAYHVVDYFVESKQQQEAFDALAQLVENAKPETEPTTSVSGENTAPSQAPGSTEPADPEMPTEPTGPVILPEYQLVSEMNPHMVGWIKIENTQVNYPVVQTPESPDYYLHRDFKQNYSSHGCIYVREQCDVNKPSDNQTLYGHNMSDGSMFRPLMNYQTKEYWEENSYIQYDTLYEHHTYQIFAVFITTASVGQGFDYHLLVDAADEEEFNSYIAAVKSMSFYETGITPEYGDKIICLSTCEYTQTNGRFVVAAVRIE